MFLGVAETIIIGSLFYICGVVWCVGILSFKSFVLRHLVTAPIRNTKKTTMETDVRYTIYNLEI